MQVITRWDPSGDGSVDKGEFRSNVFALGVVAEAAAVDALFEELDDDGGGSLDVAELKVCGARRAHTGPRRDRAIISRSHAPTLTRGTQSVSPRASHARRSHDE